MCWTSPHELTIVTLQRMVMGRMGKGGGLRGVVCAGREADRRGGGSRVGGPRIFRRRDERARRFVTFVIGRVGADVVLAGKGRGIAREQVA